MSILFLLTLVVVVLAAAGVLLAGRRRRASARGPAPSSRLAEGGLRVRLGRTRSALGGRLGAAFRRGWVAEETWDEMEEALIAADVGVTTAAEIVEEVRAGRPGDGDAARRLLETALVGSFREHERGLSLGTTPAVILVVGVNGSGKTTTIAKLAHRLRGEGRGVLLVAADTFRAGAEEQLRRWAERIDVPLVGAGARRDPASVAYDGLARARTLGVDVVIVDTAGRLHSKTNLMEELGKVARILRREAGELAEVLLVLDGTGGQSGITQAKAFTDAVGVTGIVITKLDGTARGGIAVAVERELGLPLKYIGVGERLEDLVPFEPERFVAALLEP